MREQETAPPGEVRVEQRQVNGRLVRVYVYTPWWAREDRQDPVLAMLSSLPPSERVLYRVERITAASRTSEDPKDVTIVYRRRMKVIARTKSAKHRRGFTRRPVWNMEEEPMEGEIRKIVLHDGTVTDNQGWNRRERVGKTPHYTKTVNGKVYVIDSFTAMGARVPGSFTTPETDKATYTFTPSKSSGSDRYEERTLTGRSRTRPPMHTISRSGKPARIVPVEKAHGMTSVLNKKAKELLNKPTKGRK